MPRRDFLQRGAFLSLLIAIVALGAYLRLVDLCGPSLWLDEILHLQIARSLAEEPWYLHLTGVRESDGGTENGALYYWLQIWGQKLVPGDAGARLFPALVGTLTLPLMAWAGYLLGGRLLALCATFLLAVSPLHVYFSREGRPYYLLMAAALALLCLLLAKSGRTRSPHPRPLSLPRSTPTQGEGRHHPSLEHPPSVEGSRVGSEGSRHVSVRIWAAYGVCLTAAYIGIHSVPILASFAALSGIAWLRGRGGTPRRLNLHFLAASALALLLAYGLYMTRSKINAPTLELPEKQVEIQEAPGFHAPVSRRSVETFLASMTTSGVPAAPTARSWILISLAAAGLAAAFWRRWRETAITAGMFLLPAVLSVAALMSVGRWYGVRYTSPALPAFLLLTALGITALAELAAERLKARWRPAVAWGATAVLLGVLVAPNLRAALADPRSKLDWRGVARFFDEIALEGEPVLVPNPWPQICLDYYLRARGREVEFVHVWENLPLAESEAGKRPRGWMLTAGFRKWDDVRKWMHGFVPVSRKHEEQMALFFFPDFVTLFESRFAAGKGAIFEQRFAAMGRRFEFDGSETLLQGRGWSYSETNPRGADFQWATGEQAELGLPVGPPRDLVLRLRALPFPQAPPRPLELWLGDRRLATLELPVRRWSDHQVEVPASHWQPGANVLTLRFPRDSAAGDSEAGGPEAGGPEAGDPKNPRNLRVAFDYLEVAP